MKSNKVRLEYILLIAVYLIFSNTYYFKTLVCNIMGPIKLQSATKDMEIKKFDSITCYYSSQQDGDKYFIGYIKNCLLDGEKETTKIFGYARVNPLNIVIMSSPKMFGKVFDVNPQQDISLYFWDTIYIPSDNLSQYVFVHEYTHYKMNLFCNDREIQIFNIPMWFQEGVSEYVCPPFYENKFKNAKLNKVQDFRKIEDNKGIEKSQSQGYDVYMQGYLAIKKIIQMKGQNSIQNILIDTKTMSFYDSFHKNTGVTVEEFEKLLK